MKATINGITVEGTPEEIAGYPKELDIMRRKGIHIKPPLGSPPPWIMADVTYRPKCPNEGNPCFCTGICIGQEPGSVQWAKDYKSG